MSDIQRRWDLWNLRTLFPAWGEAELTEVQRAGAAHDARQQELFADPVAAARRFEPSARQVLADQPALATGLTISLHLGPYSLAPVPWLITGHDVHVLVNRSSLAEIQPIYDELQAVLHLEGQIHWVPIEGGRFALRLLRALRCRESVFAFLDGNDGLEGSEGTLQRGIVHHLPGRAIRVRTGLARLALGLGCPVHSLVTVWDDQGGFAWQAGPSWQWPRGTTPAAATEQLFSWAFALIRRHPAQWRVWSMLTGVYDGFRPVAPPAGPDAADPWQVATAAYRHRQLVWRREIALWPGDMLEDVAESCFYTAEGLSAAELDPLQRRATFSPAEAAGWFGQAWVDTHLPRLVALGFLGLLPAAADPLASLPANPG
jgi:hypothetical protein